MLHFSQTVNVSQSILQLGMLSLVHEQPQEVDGNREDNRGVLLGRDGVQGLKIKRLYNFFEGIPVAS